MNQTSANAESIFHAALDIEDAEARSAFLDEACPDPDVRRHVERLLSADARAGAFLAAPAPAPTAATRPDGLTEGPGTIIGPYRLMEQIGEGGMGVVYVAEQARPVRRKVALKVIKPGMDTKQVVARFEAERQALALMDHPNIAKVLDGGTTESGRPYFVMELIRGRPITDYCDAERLPVRDRLELFVLLCRAVQHAHQKGVIHRDIKPTNVLITLHDGVPVPKIIDFGVAKATGQSLTDKTLYTAFTQLIGTPLYMSPEQVELSGLDVDTRSDIYSLGVLLYELLTGTTPFDGETLRKAAFDELRRIIREQEPPKPSTRLSALGVTLTAVSERRGSDPRRLNRAVRGELDWIAMKALEKDRRRRYATANDVADDVMRYLTDRPVEACPPSGWYRFTKYARRHRAALTTAVLVSLALVAGTTLSTWQAAQARRARAKAEASDEESRLVLDYLVDDVFGAARPRNLTAPELLARGEKAIATRFARRPRLEATARQAISRAYSSLGRFADAQQQARRAAEIRARVLGPDHPETLAAQAELAGALCGEMYFHYKAKPEAVPLARRVFEVRRRVLGPEHPATLASMTKLANILVWYAKYEEAVPLAEQTIPLHDRILGPDDPATLEALATLGGALIGMGGYAEAERVLRRQLEGRLRVGGPDDEGTHKARAHLAFVLVQIGRLDEALPLMYESTEGFNRINGADNPYTFSYVGGTEQILWKKGDPEALRDFYQLWLRRVLATDPDPDDADLRDKRSLRLNGFARHLMCLPRSITLDADLAVRGAEQAVALSGGGGSLTLALTYDRAGRGDKAVATLQEGMKRVRFRDDDPYPHLAVALIDARHGSHTEAREWLGKADAAMALMKGKSESLEQLRAQVVAVLDEQALPADVFAPSRRP